MSDLGTEWKKLAEDKEIKALIKKDQEGIVTTKDINISSKTPERKEFLIVKDINLKPTSFHFKYNENWLKEDTNHFHSVLRQYNEDIPIQDYDNKHLLTNALQKVKKKRQTQKNLVEIPKEENFTIDAENEIDEDFNISESNDKNKTIIKPSKALETLPGKTIDSVLYDDFKAKHVKVIHTKPMKMVYSNRRFCQAETLSTRTIDRLRKEGISIENLKKNNLERYYNSFNRCYDPGKFELKGKYYCRLHFRDKKYGRVKDEDFHD